MTISAWRYSHLALALSSFLFIALATITGIALAFAPVSESLSPYAVECSNQSLGRTLANVERNFPEVISVSLEHERFMKADVIDADGNSKQVYIDPVSGKSLGPIQPPNAFFEFVTTLHRSLFLHGLGRFFMGLTCLFLFMIALTGAVLVIRRQRGIGHFFSRVVRDDFYSYYHVLFGRVWLLPILIISASGFVLTLDGFQLLEKKALSHAPVEVSGQSENRMPLDQIPVFAQTSLRDLKQLEFPFSTDPEDAFTLRTNEAEFVVNQFSGQVISKQDPGITAKFLELARKVHTAETSVVWAVVIMIACLNILFFIYSGFAMTLKRRSGAIRNVVKAQQAKFVVLVGSENGGSMQSAKAFQSALLKAGQLSHITELTKYDVYPNAEHLIVISSTYGNGEAPANARKAISRIRGIKQQRPIAFSVVGFGSHAYPDFCRFAFELFDAMSLEKNLESFLDIHTINDKSVESFDQWARLWAQKAQIDLKPDYRSLFRQAKNTKNFEVVSKTTAEPGHTFILQLRPPPRQRFESGDLLCIYPARDHRSRQYSIGKVDATIQLSVKRHENGLGSEFLYGLSPGDSLPAIVSENPEFHFNETAVQNILICNGTGIAPFLGMIAQNKKSEVHLYCGFRTRESLEPYREFLKVQLAESRLRCLQIAYSREGEKKYVKDLLGADSDFVASALRLGGSVMICGSLAMQQNVIEVLEAICSDKLDAPLSHFQAAGQIKTDCY